MTPTPTAAAPPKRRKRTRYLDGNKLLKIRVELDLSQRGFAAKIGNGVTQSLVSAWERGRQGTSLANVHQIAGSLGRKPEDLMPDELLARISASSDKPGHGTAGSGKLAMAAQGRPE